MGVMKTVEDLGMQVLVGAEENPLAIVGLDSTPAPTVSAPTTNTTIDAVGRSVSSIVYGTLFAVSSGASFWHGLKRNDSVGWGLWWSFWGGVFPVVVPLYAMYEGFAVPRALSKRP
jgi:hypothetical protein